MRLASCCHTYQYLVPLRSGRGIFVVFDQRKFTKLFWIEGYLKNYAKPTKREKSTLFSALSSFIYISNCSLILI